METFKKYWGFGAMIIGGCLGVFGWVYNQGADSKSLEGRTFDSPEQKVYVVKSVEDSPTPEQKQRAYFIDSINKVHAMKSRNTRDSLLQAELKLGKIRDSIQILNADQLYQTKQVQQEILQEIKAIKEHR